MSEEILKWLVNQSIATLVLLWFMLRMERVINNNTKAIKELQKKINKLF